MATPPAYPGPVVGEPATNQASLSSGRVRLAPARVLEGSGLIATRVGMDIGLLTASIVAAIGSASAAGQRIGFSFEPWLLLFAVLVLGVTAQRKSYDARTSQSIVDVLLETVAVVVLVALSVIGLAVVLAPADGPPILVERAALYALPALVTGRVLLTWAQRRARVRSLIGTPTVIVGAGMTGAHIERRLLDRPELGLRPVAFVDDDPLPDEIVRGRRSPILGALGDLPSVVLETGARHVIIAYTGAPDAELAALARRCSELGLQVALVPRLYEQVNRHVVLEHIGGMPLLELRPVDTRGFQFAIKHAFDRIAAAAILTLIAPLLLTLALLIKRSSPGPVFYRQPRIGRDGQRFDILKFRSMRPLREGEVDNVPAVLSDEDMPPGGIAGGLDRRTRVGRFMRARSLDELPQLINVLRGEMSLVGPRPEQPQFIERFERSIDRYEDRHRVRSGITGWAQIHGLRGPDTSLRERIELDNHYIENWSLGLDLKILLVTAFELFSQRAE